ncbi:TAF5-like RNA polymerase II p300/CBP-associated factor-associated factor 65 kDa subunit 5L [Neodiprion pinetum]|uniref:TAF5-like RNA polymerase II p300/CBP-associated factor-associated factor 65 kDa subunit 5L n=1 Tax=Neodiprion lecontei TaxID=441921 RepID=A0A6J0BU89_NEOLC|nr:TAF5-like RNA polymerase II p300/CBP-associated factor-associated factor 65 kDa subunit 5L [Neodiprion lecontei]XP_046480046.1 TAF5-like RNA polymerase II p300/CBP-associated factor-associated factor 65 kDa subunit 5L [Neodiprion pinetum]
MKRSKIDIINATVESYLKRRHYHQESDIFRKSERGDCQTSAAEMTLSTTVECSTSRENSIVFSAITNDAGVADQAYHKLKIWIQTINNENLKIELQGVLYPIFCHLYLEMLHGGNRQTAIQFLKMYQNDFVSDTERDFLEELSSVFSIQDIELRPLVNAFRTRKYKVDMSDDAHFCLQKFLAKQGHVILMQVINTHVTIIRKIPEVHPDEDRSCERGPNRESVINGHVEQPSGTGVDREMRELQEAIRLIRSNVHQPLRVYAINNANENASCGSITPNIDRLAAGFSTSEIRLWGISDTVLTRPRLKAAPLNFASNNPSTSRSLWTDDHMDEAGAIVMRGHTDVVHDLKFIPEADVLLSVSSDKDMRAWRLSDYSCAAIYNGHNYPVWCMDTSVFNLYIATGSHDRTAKLWSLDRTFPLRIFAGHFLDVNCIRFHPNARYLATGSADKTIRLWSKDDGSLVRVYVGARSTIYSLAFSPDGKYLAAAGDDKSVSIWDLATNTQLIELKGHQDTVMNLDWSSDGQYIASASIDGVVRLWSTQRHINTSNGDNTNSQSGQDNSQVYPTNCSSILSLQYYHKNDSLVCIGTS